ncbi:MAG: CDP-alcohol phosphatidyltransferase family protein [Arachnia sp.]
MSQSTERLRSRPLLDAAIPVAAAVAMGVVLSALVGAGSIPTAAGTTVGLVIPAAAALSILRRRPPATTTADRITLIRAVLTGGCATLVMLSLVGDLPLRSWPLFALALPAWLLDGVDGWVARRTGTASAAGARLDMETDAALFLVLSFPLCLAVGPWVLGIGAMRYLFLVAGWVRPSLRGSLAFSSFRRVAAGIQGGVLVVALIPAIPAATAAVATALSLVLLLTSFGRDVITLEKVHAGSVERHTARREAGHER